MLDKFERIAALRPARKRIAVDDGSRQRAGQGDGLAELLGATVERNRYGEHLVVRRWYSSPEPCAATPDALRLLLPPVPARAKRGTGLSLSYDELADPARWLFLDTETTGLAGGTGTNAFLVGVAWWEAGGLQVEQFFMRDHDEEHAVLTALNERLAERGVLVTFNGKSFDWPLLETRFTMTRAIRPRAPAAHLDLLHPARQLWKLRLGSVRLSELERHVLGAERLGWSRQRDIDSALIPQIYFDYLRGASPEPLAGVFHHNQMDLRGLAALAGRIFGLLQAAEQVTQRDASAPHDSGPQHDGSIVDGLELFGLSRIHQRRGEAARAQRLYERAIDAGLPRGVDASARRELALLARRQGDYGRAASHWEELVGAQFIAPLPGPGRNDLGGTSGAPSRAGYNGIHAIEAFEQLAIHYEHRAREPHRAAEYARAAHLELRRALRLGLIEPARGHKLQGRFDHRLKRLERRAALEFLDHRS